MSLPTFSMRDLLQAGVHFGHHPRRWNPKMEPYIFGVRSGIHIINLEKTFPLLRKALTAVKEVASKGGRILFVGTKRQASDIIAAEAKRCSQYYVNHRWLGGMMTNWKTVSKSIGRLKDLDKQLQEENEGLTKKELLKLTREHDKLELSLGGIQEMGNVPDLLFVIDTNKEKNAILEAQKIGMPVVAVVDSNSDPEGIDFPIPGNDDAIRSIEFYCRMVSSTILQGLQAQMQAAGVDLGASEEMPIAEEASTTALQKDEEPTEAGTEESTEVGAQPAGAEKSQGKKKSSAEIVEDSPDAKGATKKSSAEKKKPAEAKAAVKKPAEKKKSAEGAGEESTEVETPEAASKKVKN